MVRFGLIGAVMLSVISLAPEAWAASPYDGYWSVVIQTLRGACEPAYRSAVFIRDGVVSGGDGVAQLYGRVNRRGRVSVVVRSGTQTARGTGRLGRRSGGGSWSGVGTAGRCSGRWAASRR